MLLAFMSIAFEIRLLAYLACHMRDRGWSNAPASLEFIVFLFGREAHSDKMVSTKVITSQSLGINK